MTKDAAHSSTESILDRMGLAREANEDELVDEFDGESEYRAFAASRNPRRVETMLDLVFRSGAHESLSYAHLYQISFDPSNGLLLNFTDHLVTIQGHRLLDLYRYLKNHRVTYICEADLPTAKLVGESEAVVNEISINLKEGRQPMV